MEHDFFSEIVPNWVYFGQAEDIKLTTELSKKVQYSRNQAIKDSLNEAIVLMSINKALLSRENFASFKLLGLNAAWRWLKFLTGIQYKYPILPPRWHVNKHSDPIFYCIFWMFISWMLITLSFKKCLIVEQLQGNYLKWLE